MTYKHRLQRLTDDELLQRLDALLNQSRRVEADLVAHIAEVDARRLFASRAASSMFQYAIEILHLSEAEAYLRIAVARASRMHPVLLEMLGDGRLHLSGIALLAKHLTESNRDGVLARAAHKTKREIEELIAELAPRPDVPPMIRKQPVRRALVVPAAPASVLCPDKATPAAAPQPPDPKPAVEPLAPQRYKVTFTADASLRDKLRRLEALMKSDLAEAIDAAVTEKLERLEAARFAKTKAPRKTLEETDTTATSSRYLPAAVKRAVCVRDGDRCTFVDESGRRWYLAEREYGKDLMDAFRRSADRVSEPMPAYFVRTELERLTEYSGDRMERMRALAGGL